MKELHDKNKKFFVVFLLYQITCTYDNFMVFLIMCPIIKWWKSALRRIIVFHLHEFKEIWFCVTFCAIISLFIQFREHELKNGCDFNIKVKWERFTTMIILWYQLYTECCYAHISPSHHGTTIPSVASFTEWFILLVPYSIILYTRYVVFLLPAHARLPSNGIDSPFYCLNT